MSRAAVASVALVSSLLLSLLAVASAMEQRQSAVDCCGSLLAGIEVALSQDNAQATRDVLVKAAASAGYRCEPVADSGTWRCR